MNRAAGRKALATVLSLPKNIDILERNIAEVADKAAQDDQKTIYRDTCMFVVQKISNGIKLNKILQILKSRQVGFDSDEFSHVRASIKEQQSFLENPFEVDEGVLECKCGSRRTISFSKQIRCGDEGTTVFAKCVDCGKTWNA